MTDTVIVNPTYHRNMKWTDRLQWPEKAGVKDSNAHSARSPVADEEMIRTGQLVGSVLCVFFSALILLAEWQEEHPAH